MDRERRKLEKWLDTLAVAGVSQHTCALLRRFCRTLYDRLKARDGGVSMEKLLSSLAGGCVDAIMLSVDVDTLEEAFERNGEIVETGNVADQKIDLDSGISRAVVESAITGVSAAAEKLGECLVSKERSSRKLDALIEEMVNLAVQQHSEISRRSGEIGALMSKKTLGMRSVADEVSAFVGERVSDRWNELFSSMKARGHWADPWNKVVESGQELTMEEVRELMSQVGVFVNALPEKAGNSDLTKKEFENAWLRLDSRLLSLMGEKGAWRPVLDGQAMLAV